MRKADDMAVVKASRAAAAIPASPRPSALPIERRAAAGAVAGMAAV